MRVLVFGDSLTYDTSLPGDNWPRFLYKEYKDRIAGGEKDSNLPEIYNQGISGDKIDNLLKRLEIEIAARKWRKDDVAVVFLLGTNDSRVEEGQSDSSPQQFRQDLQEILNKSSKFTKRILFIGLPAVDEKRSNPVPWEDKDISYTNERVRAYDAQIKELAQQNGLVYVPLYEKFLERPDLLLDGVHPTEEGQRFIAETVKPAIEELVK
jgi:acyl-CoA thioesterase-1